MPPSKRLDLLPCRADADHRREFNSSTDNLKAMIRTLRRKDSATGCSVSSQSRLICVLLRRVFCHKPHTSSSSPLIISYFKSSCLRHDLSLSLRVFVMVHLYHCVSASWFISITACLRHGLSRSLRVCVMVYLDHCVSPSWFFSVTEYFPLMCSVHIFW